MTPSAAYTFGAEGLAFTGALLAVHFVGVKVFGLSHLDAHFLPQLIAFCVTAALGAQAWFGAGMHSDLSLAWGVFTYSRAGDLIATLQVGLQVYEVACACVERKLRGGSGEMLVHHALACLLAWLGCRYKVFLTYSVYYLGISELSSVPLAGVDFFKHRKPLAKKYPQATNACRQVFAACFIVLRTLYWPYVSYFFWTVSLAALREGTPAPNIVRTFLAFNFVLTALQLFWTGLIVQGVVKLLSAKPPKKD